MRFLVLLVLVSAAGCSCDFRWSLDECSSDSDCFDDDNFCNGTRVCERVRYPSSEWLECVDHGPYCGEGTYCDEGRDACVPCTGPSDAPECESLYDAGTPVPDGGPPLCTHPEGIGSRCTSGGCVWGLDCVDAVIAELGPTTRTFTGVCSVFCDPTAAETGCRPCAACIDSLRVGSEQVAAAEVGRAPYCALRCEPSQTETGCARYGFSCDVITGTCQDACTSDEECRLVRDELGALVEDPARSHACDAVTGRCRMPGTPGAQVGDPCASDGDCMLDGVCLHGDGWPDAGYCTRLDCQWPELACAEGEQCHHRALERPACLMACIAGTEPESDRLGVGGHGAGCSPGFSCRVAGQPRATRLGGCVPGNYNDVATPNLGEPCTRDDECYSPFGLGRCAWSSTEMGTCAVIDCDVLGVCADGECARLDEGAFCLRQCASASECAPGYACVRASPSGSLACIPSCTADADCRAGERCDGTECSLGGACRCLPL